MEERKLIFLVCILISTIIQVSAIKKSYIVYLGSHRHGNDATIEEFELAKNSHYKLLGSFVGSEEKARDAIFYSYTKNINGFAATLEEKEAEEIAKHPDVVSVFPNKIYKLHTTRSWSFVDIVNTEPSVPGETNIGSNVIIATLDTGVWPESRSFSDVGIGPIIPAKWNGYCEENTTDFVPCNRKLIGARYFNKGILKVYPNANITNSVRDTEGHGSHTLSTAAGWFVPGANSFGYANGTARGGSPGAFVAAYKVCWPDGCSNADILAGYEAAIHDNVDIISVSLGGGPAFYGGTQFLDDAVALGSLHAVAKGITVVCSAGNDGPFVSTVSNVAPWVVTVAASTLDRDFPSSLRLGSKHLIQGASQETKSLPQNHMYPLINGSDAASLGGNVTLAQWCNTSSLDPAKVKGKIVICVRDGTIARIVKGITVRDAGGIGMILVNNEMYGDILAADPHVLPATMISYKDGLTLFSYMSSTKNPRGNISPQVTRIGSKQAPMMAEFSSRGPSYSTPEILKPDVTAPGVQILAAYSELVSPTGLEEDKRRTPYFFLSGTSMSCPHVSGVAGLLKSANPNWSAAAIKSAIMTTATTKDNKNMPMRDYNGTHEATPFEYGNGHIRPARAVSPGLVYDNTIEEYLNFLCTLGFNATYLSGFTSKPFECPSEPLKLENLNYPSISVAALKRAVVVTRTLKNVGLPGTYKVRVVPPPRVDVAVRPSVLSFSRIGEEKSYSVAMMSRIKDEDQKGFKFGRLVWSDGTHFVRSSIAVNITA